MHRRMPSDSSISSSSYTMTGRDRMMWVLTLQRSSADCSGRCLQSINLRVEARTSLIRPPPRLDQSLVDLLLMPHVGYQDENRWTRRNHCPCPATMNLLYPRARQLQLLHSTTVLHRSRAPLLPGRRPLRLYDPDLSDMARPGIQLRAIRLLPMASPHRCRPSGHSRAT